MLLGIGAVGAFLAVDLGAVAYANHWVGPHSGLNRKTFMEAFRRVYGLHPGFRRNHAKGVAVSGHFDSNGNGGTSAWVNGRVVGCWVQDDDGRVVVLPATPLTKRHRNLLHDEADRLTTFLDATVITNVYKSRLMKGERLP